MDTLIETHSDDIEKIKQELRRLDINKMDKTKFDELMNLINDLKKKMKEMADKIDNIKDFSKEIHDLQTGQDNITNNHNTFVDATNSAI